MKIAFKINFIGGKMEKTKKNVIEMAEKILENMTEIEEWLLEKNITLSLRIKYQRLAFVKTLKLLQKISTTRIRDALTGRPLYLKNHLKEEK